MINKTLTGKTLNSLLIKLLLFVIAGVIYPMWGFAMPTVSGNTLSWPADGWYQVQSAENYETVCEGVVSADAGLDGGPCLVDSGRYIVINHSSGERFENCLLYTSPSPRDS